MTSPDEDAFEPQSDGASAASTSANEGSNVCRAAALAFLLRGVMPARRGLTDELGALGFSNVALRESGPGWAEQNPLGRVGSYVLGTDINLDASRTRGWAEMNENADPVGAVGFLLAMLGSVLERESTAAAAALWRGLELGTQFSPPTTNARTGIDGRLHFDLDFGRRRGPWPLHPLQFVEQLFSAIDSDEMIRWDAGQWRATFQQFSYRLDTNDPYAHALIIATIAFARLTQALRSPDDITRSLALAAVVPTKDSDSSTPPPDQTGTSTKTSDSSLTSTILHGTRGWIGDWWRPKGDFHQFIQDNYRPSLYSGGGRFSWSGKYSASHRAKAAQDFDAWVADLAPSGIKSLFGHSYGGEIASRAWNLGTPIQELVLLSAPVTVHVEDAAHAGADIIDIRLPLDPVLALELRPQRIATGSSVKQVLTSWSIDHGATHKEKVWQSDRIAQRAQIQPEPALFTG